jgi:hypothetical protein
LILASCRPILWARPLHSNDPMREETRPLDNLKPLAEGLQHATGVPFPEAVQTLRWVQAYVRRCLETGLANDLLIAMERSGLGDMAEALLEVGRRAP